MPRHSQTGYYFAVLANFVTDIERVVLEPDLDLVRLRDDQRQQLVVLPFQIGRPIGEESPPWTHAVRCLESEEVITNTSLNTWWDYFREKVRSRLADAVVALRLILPGRVAVGTLRQEWVEVSPRPGRIAGYSEVPEAEQAELASLRWTGQSLPASTLSEENVEQFRKLYDRLRTREVDRTFELALRRFNRAYSRESDEDRLIDCWIGLEALFASDSTQELRFRASLRIARFLRDTKEEREDLFRRMKASYDLRSVVVHGDDPAGTRGRKSPPLSETAMLTEDVLRQALRLWLDPARSHALEDIDSTFLS